MAQYETILLDIKDRVATVTFNRPDIHNPFNDVMLKELIVAFDSLRDDDRVRVVVLTGAGKSFCAGADLNWMKRVIAYSYEENLEDSNLISECMHRLYTLPQPTIARVNGAAIGGGMGFVSACDIVIGSEKAVFSLSEARIGLIPACISPYVVKRAGEARCREFFLTGERLSAERAREAGLINQAVPHDQLDSAVEEMIQKLLRCGPNAQTASKELLAKLAEISLEEAKGHTAHVIATLRISDEGQEGMTAFLEKRPPAWLKEES
jgi:methylglutaconyl-CoA hydratase